MKPITLGVVVASYLLAAIGCAPNLVTYPSGEIRPIGPPPQKQANSPEATATAVELWNAIDAILQFHQSEMRPVFDGLHNAAQKMDHDAFDVLVVAGLGKSDKMFLLVLDGEEALKRFERNAQPMKQKERAVLAADAFLRQARLWINQGRQVLEDGYAYNRSWHEKNLSHLNDKNEASFNNGAKQFHQQEQAVRDARDMLAQALQELFA